MSASVIKVHVQVFEHLWSVKTSKKQLFIYIVTHTQVHVHTSSQTALDFEFANALLSP